MTTGNGWAVWQPFDDEDEAVYVSVTDGNGVTAEQALDALEATKMRDALNEALGNIEPPTG